MSSNSGLNVASALTDYHLPITPELPTSVNGHRRRDEFLVHRIRNGEKELFYELIRPHLRMLHGTVQKNVQNTANAEDIVQQSIMQAFVHFHQLRSPQFFRAWLIRIAINEARIARRRDPRVCLNSIEADVEGENGEPLVPYGIRDQRAIPSEVLEHKELQEIVRRAVQRLPLKLREVLILRDLEEYSIKDVAQELGISIPATKTRLLRARIRLRALIRQTMDLKFKSI